MFYFVCKRTSQLKDRLIKMKLILFPFYNSILLISFKISTFRDLESLLFRDKSNELFPGSESILIITACTQIMMPQKNITAKGIINLIVTIQKIEEVLNMVYF